MLTGKDTKAYEYVKAQQIRQRAIEDFKKVFEEVDVLITPTLPILPTNIGQREVDIHGHKDHVQSALVRLTGPTNLTGFPSLSIPCGFSRNGLPIGLQLIGRFFDESNLYRVGYAFEQERCIPTLKWEIK